MSDEKYAKIHTPTLLAMMLLSKSKDNIEVKLSDNWTKSCLDKYTSLDTLEQMIERFEYRYKLP